MTSSTQRLTKASLKINWHWVAAFFALVIFFFAAKALYHLAHSVSFVDIKVALLAMSPLQLTKAVVVVVIAYVLLSVYDLIALRYLKSKIHYSGVLATSFSAFSIGHTLGVSMLSAGAVRLRFYSQAGLVSTQIANVILLVSLAFGYGTMTVIGASLALNPNMMTDLVSHFANIPSVIFRLIGLAILLVIFGSIAYAGKVGKQFVLRTKWFNPIELQLPPAQVLIKLLVVAVIDIALVAYLIHLLLAETHVSYLAVFSAYVQSITAGIISHVPGGLGVFELTMVGSLPQVDKAKLLSVLLVFRVLYYFIPFVLGIVVFLLTEAKHQVGQAASKSEAKPIWSLGYLIPQLLGMATAALGATMLIISLLPPSGNRELLLGEFFPVTLIEASYLLNTAIGFVLIVLARGLYQGLKGAWHVLVWLLTVSVILLLIKGLEYEMALISSVLLAVVFYFRSSFTKASTLTNLRLNTQSFLLLAVFLLSLFWIGMAAHRFDPYSADIWWQVSSATSDPETIEAARFLRASLVVAIMLLGYTVFSLLRFAKTLPSLPSKEELDTAERIVSNATQTVANLSLLGDKQLLFSNSQSSFLMYQIQGRSWVVMSDPVGQPSEFLSLIEAFLDLCNNYGGTPVFYEVTGQYEALYRQNGLQLLKIGEEAIVDLHQFSLEGKANAKHRQAISKGTREGMSFEVINKDLIPQYLDELKAVSDSWLGDKVGAEKGFSLGYFDQDYLKRFDCAVIKLDGRIIAFANLWQSADHHEASIDLMRYIPNSAKGVMDFLFVNLMMWSKDEGYAQFSLGMAPFSGFDDDQNYGKWGHVVGTVSKYSKSVYNAEGLKNFKQKYNPNWQPRYIAIKAGLSTVRGLTDTTVLISGGLDKMVRLPLRTKN